MSILNKPEFIIFDLDGTLIQQTEFYKSVYSHTLTQIIQEERGETGLQLLDFYRKNYEGKGELTLFALGIPFGKWATKLIQAPVTLIRPNPTTVKLLRDVQIPCIVFTGSPKSMAKRLLRQFGCDPEKDFLNVIGWETHEFFPLKWNCSPYIFTSICERYSVDPKSVWSVGDTWDTDLLPAQQIGMTTVQIQKRSGNPDYHFDTVEEFLRFLNE